jgi:hypothetical protein
MTFIEQKCQQGVIALWRNRPNYAEARVRLFVRFLEYAEASGYRPTSSAYIVACRGLAAAGAKAYRQKAPAISQWTSTVVAEPKLVVQKLSQIRTNAQDEIRLQRDIVARMVKSGV